MFGEFVDWVTGAAKRREDADLRSQPKPTAWEDRIDPVAAEAEKARRSEVDRERLRKRTASPGERLKAGETTPKVRARIDAGNPKHDPASDSTPKEEIEATRLELQRTAQPPPVVLGPGQTAAPNRRAWKPPSPGPEPDPGPDKGPNPSPAGATAKADVLAEMLIPLSPEEHRQWVQAYGEQTRGRTQDRSRTR